MIRYDERGEKVKKLQLCLTQLGINPGPIDGIFGPLTLSAWTIFKQKHLIDYKTVINEEFETLKQISSRMPSRNGKGVLINNGHSDHNNGAFSDNKAVAEYDLNLRQAEHISLKLSELGIPNKIINQTEVGSLWDTGLKAEGYDMFCSLHHNSTPGVQYSCYVLGKNAKEGSKRFGPSVSKRIAGALNIEDSGSIDMGYPISIIESAETTNCPVVVLIESYFINPIEDYDQAHEWSDKAADAIVEAIVDWFKL